MRSAFLITVGVLPPCVVQGAFPWFCVGVAKPMEKTWCVRDAYLRFVCCGIAHMAGPWFGAWALPEHRPSMDARGSHRSEAAPLGADLGATFVLAGVACRDESCHETPPRGPQNPDSHEVQNPSGLTMELLNGDELRHRAARQHSWTRDRRGRRGCLLECSGVGLGQFSAVAEEVPVVLDIGGCEG